MAPLASAHAATHQAPQKARWPIRADVSDQSARTLLGVGKHYSPDRELSRTSPPYPHCTIPTETTLTVPFAA